MSAVVHRTRMSYLVQVSQMGIDRHTFIFRFWHLLHANFMREPALGDLGFIFALSMVKKAGVCREQLTDEIRKRVLDFFRRGRDRAELGGWNPETGNVASENTSIAQVVTGRGPQIRFRSE